MIPACAPKPKVASSARARINQEQSPTMNEATQPWYKQFWPWFLIILRSIAVVASLTSVGIAVVNRDSLVRDNYYKDGLAINTELDQDKTAMARGIAVDGSVDHRVEGHAGLASRRAAGASFRVESHITSAVRVRLRWQHEQRLRAFLAA